MKAHLSVSVLLAGALVILPVGSARGAAEGEPAPAGAAPSLPIPITPAAEVQHPAPVIVTRDQDVYSLTAQDATLEEILAALKTQSAIALEVDPSLLGNRMTLHMERVSYEKIVEILAGSHALIYERTEDGGYRLTQARLTAQQAYVAPKLPDLNRKERRDVKELTARAREMLEAHSQVIQNVGELDYDAAKALIAGRAQKMQEIIDELAKLGPGGARAMRDAIDAHTQVREDLAVIKALALIDDPEASVVLGNMYGDLDAYSLQREVVGSLGQRKDAETQAILLSILQSTEDKRLRAGVVQALSGRPAALDDLLAVVNSAAEAPDVRTEAIRSMGLIGDDAARSSLETIAGGSEYTLALRKSAIQELGRSFSGAAVPALQGLLKDHDDAIRQSAVRALSRVDSQEATELLRAVATGDVSLVIRAQADAALSARGAGVAAPASTN